MISREITPASHVGKQQDALTLRQSHTAHALAGVTVALAQARARATDAAARAADGTAS